ncbi:MAG TPA: hypothetical protein VI776_13915 [Anaerolineales bacterium]|nr:hypothetical protein [Anaerolineales bacterium]
MEDALTKQPIRSNRTLILGIGLAAALLISIALALSITLSGSRRGEAAELSQAAFEAKTGMRVVRVALATGGGMVDLRYQVLDPDKAVIVHDDQNPPAILDQASGKILNIPWMAHASKHTLRTGITYYVLLLNQEGVLKRGSRVTVILGGVSLENVVVQ